ncbi:hypothetical protein ACHWQZ_G007716 [Mnemiopsis leidyi]
MESSVEELHADKTKKEVIAAEIQRIDEFTSDLLKADRTSKALAIDVQETCKEVKEALTELLLDYDEYAFHSTRIIDYCETLEQNAKGISSQLDHRTGDEVLSYDTLDRGLTQQPQLTVVVQ